MKALLYKTEKHVPTASGYTALENMETAGIITTYYFYPSLTGTSRDNLMNCKLVFQIRIETYYISLFKISHNFRY